MILSDTSIRSALENGRIEIDPLDTEAIEPASVDVRLSPLFRVFRSHRRDVIDVQERMGDLTELAEVKKGNAFVLHPGEFVLASTLERIRVCDDLVARVEGKSSLGRLGLLIHCTAGYVDPGFNGQITLELSNVASLPIRLYPDMKIAQVSFIQMTTASEVPYSEKKSAKYQHQAGPEGSAYWKNFDKPYL